MQQEDSTIRIDPSNSTIGEGIGQGNVSSRPNFEGLGKIKETPEETKNDKHTPPSRLLSSADMHQSPISFGSNAKMQSKNQTKMEQPMTKAARNLALDSGTGDSYERDEFMDGEESSSKEGKRQAF